MPGLIRSGLHISPKRRGLDCQIANQMPDRPRFASGLWEVFHKLELPVVWPGDLSELLLYLYEASIGRVRYYVHNMAFHVRVKV